MDQSNNCPDEATLGQLMHGYLSEAKSEALEAHLLTCDQCGEHADTIEPDADLTSAFRNQNMSPTSNDVLDKVIEKAKRLLADPPQEETIVRGNAMTRDNSCPTERIALDKMDFLAPPEAEGEIGRLGGYRVLEVIGRGGMGIVFRAEDPQLHRQIALKVIRPEYAFSHGSSVERFLREARAAAAIDHDHVIAIHQAGEEQGLPFIAMPLLQGESLKSRLKQTSPLTEKEVLRIGREIAEGLSAAHGLGIVHRDIKPENVWLESRSGRVKILDFGLARNTVNADAELSQEGQIVGTPRYMSPEQANGQPVDFRSDLFSLGSLLYHLVSWEPPFLREDLTSVLVAVAKDQPRPLPASISTDFAKLIGRLMEKSADQRPGSAQEVALEIARVEQQVSTNLPALERQPGSTQKRWRISKVLLGIVASLFCGAIVIKIVQKDGTVTEVRVPDATKSVTIDFSREEIEPHDETEPNHITPRNDDIDQLNLNHQVSEFVLKKEAYLSVYEPPDIHGLRSVSRMDELPEDFRIWSIHFNHTPINTSLSTSELKSIAALQGLQELWFIRPQISDTEVKTIASIQSLESLRLAGAGITDASMKMLPGINRLKAVSLAQTEITDDGLKHLVKIPSMSSLVLEDCQQITAQGLDVVPQLERLHDLSLSQIPVSKSVVAGIGQLKRLEVLSLRWTPIKSAWLSSISGQKKLWRLVLIGTGVGDDVIETVLTLPRLSELSLRKSEITNDGLSKIAELRSLRNLDVFDTLVTPAHVRAIHNKMPLCEITFLNEQGELEVLKPQSEQP